MPEQTVKTFREFFAENHPGIDYPGRADELTSVVHQRIADAVADYMDYVVSRGVIPQAMSKVCAQSTNTPRPIETAPKDGRDVLLFIPKYGWRIGSYQVSKHETNGKVTYSSEGWDAGLMMLTTDKIMPTHWADLPPNA